MNKINADYVIFDFDGVLVDSTAMKTSIFKEVVSDWPESLQEEFIKYHKLNGGLSRWQKFDYFLREIVKLDEQEVKIKSPKLAEKFSQLLASKLSSLIFTAGAIELLKKFKAQQIPVFIVSGGAEVEVKEIVNRNQAVEYFELVLGSPVKKNENLILLKDQKKLEGKGIFIGDSYTDYNCAMEFGMSFIFMKEFSEWENWEEKQKDFFLIINNLTELI